MALGANTITLASGSELRGMGAITLTDLVNFAKSTSTATLSATTGGTFAIGSLDTSNATALTFGSKGNTGTVVLAGPVSEPRTVTVTVAYGTLENGGGLDGLTFAGGGPGTTTTVNPGATVALNDLTTPISNLEGSGAVTLGKSASTLLLLEPTISNINFGGVISGSGKVDLDATYSSMAYFLTGTNTYTGGTTITSGNLVLGNGGTTGSIVGDVTDNITLTFDHHSPTPSANTFTFAGNISGSGKVVQGAASVLTLSGNNTYTGGTTVSFGTLIPANSHALGSGAVTLDSGTELRSMGTLTLTNTVNFGSGTTDATISAPKGGTFTIGSLDLTNTSAVTFGSAGNTGTVVIGSSVIEPSPVAVTVAFGTLQNGGGLSTLTNTASSVTVNSGATLNANDQSVAVNQLDGSGAVTLGKLATTDLFLVTLHLASDFGGVISGAGQVTIDGGVTLSGANTYTGGTTVSSGIFTLGGNGSIAGNVALSLTGEFLFDHTSAYAFGGVISGQGFVVQSGPGVITLNGKNTYSGGTYLQNQATLVVGNANALGTEGVGLHNGTELRGGMGAITLANTVSFATGTTNATLSAVKGGTFTLESLDMTKTADLTFGTAGNTGTVAIGNSVAAPNPVAITVAYGTLQNGGGLGTLTNTASSVTVNSGATLNVNDQSLTINRLEGSGAVTLGKLASTVLTLAPPTINASSLTINNVTFGGAISGSGQVNLDAASYSTEYFLTGTNTYTGGTTITLGNLFLGVNNTPGSIVGNVTDNSTLTFCNFAANAFPGVISGSGQVVVQSAPSALTLSGVNTYTGGTLNYGTLVATNQHSFGAGAVTMYSGSELRGMGTAVAIGNEVNFGSNVVNATISATAGSSFYLGFLDATNANVLTFGSPGNTGTVAIGNSVAAPNPVAITVAYGTLANDGNLQPLVTTGGSITVDSGATLLLNYMSMEIGNLRGSGSVNLGTSVNTEFQLMPTIDGLTFDGVISGKGQLFLDLATSTNTYNLNGTNTYTGGTTITKGILSIGDGGTTGSIVGNVTDNSTLQFDHSNAYTFSGVISGTGAVSIANTSTGVTTLSAKNTYSGGTTLSSGTLIATNAQSLGAATGAVTLSKGTELRGMGTFTLGNTVQFATGTNNAILSAAAGSVVTLDALDVSNTSGITFGSKGNIGTLILDSVTASGALAVIVADGTVQDGGGLGTLTSNSSSFTINAGATLTATTFNLTIGNLQGSGAINLGTHATTAVTLGGGNFSGVISGVGKVNLAGNVTLTGASTYTGGTAVAGGTALANNTTGSATGTGLVTIDAGATLGGRGTIKGAIDLEGGTIAPSGNVSSTPATILHGTSLLWDTGALQFQIGSKADELDLSGAFTKGSGNTFDIDILAANGASTISDGTYTLLQFGSTTFAQGDFHLELPDNVSGMLLETKTALELEIMSSELPTSALATSSPDGTSNELPAPTFTASSSNSELTLTPAPEPGSALLLVCGSSLFLTRHRRRRVGAK